MSVAIVTGGAKGIGEAIVEELAKMGIRVVLNYHHSEQKAQEVKQRLRKEGYEIEIFQADVSNKEQAEQLVSYTKYIYGTIDILVNNAGISQIKMFQDITKQDWDIMLQTNLTSAFYMTQEVLKEMLPNKRGCIINISSIDAITGASCEVHYSVAKAGLDGMTKALAKEVAPSGIRVNSIAPGAIETQMNKNLSEQTKKTVEQEIPLGRFGKPKDIAKCVRWLIEDEYTTGQIISPNGGWVI